MKPYMWIWPIILFVLGLLSPVFGVVNYMQAQKNLATYDHATATLTEYIPDPNPKAPDYCPRYQFTTTAGQTINFTGDDCPSEPDNSRIGQTEEVYFDPQNPRTVFDKPSGTDAIIIGIGGCILFPLLGAASLGFQYWQLRRKQSRR